MRPASPRCALWTGRGRENKEVHLAIARARFLTRQFAHAPHAHRRKESDQAAVVSLSLRSGVILLLPTG